jgi:hypothetical protein
VTVVTRAVPNAVLSSSDSPESKRFRAFAFIRRLLRRTSSSLNATGIVMDRVAALLGRKNDDVSDRSRLGGPSETMIEGRAFVSARCDQYILWNGDTVEHVFGVVSRCQS